MFIEKAMLYNEFHKIDFEQQRKKLINWICYFQNLKYTQLTIKALYAYTYFKKIDDVIFSGFLEILDLRFKGKFYHFSDSF